MFLELSFELGSLGSEAAEDAAFGCGAYAVTFVDAQDPPVSHPTKSGPTLAAGSLPLAKTPDFVGTPVLEPAPGEFRLWSATRVRCLFAHTADFDGLAHTLGAALGVDSALIGVQEIPDRLWEREWLKDFHALRFGKRLWVCPHHERIDAPGAAVVMLDPGLAFGTGTHASTALCLEWLDAHFPDLPAPAEHSAATEAQGLDAHFPDLPAPAEHSVDAGAQGLDTHFPESPAPVSRVVDFGCGSGVLALAAAKLGAAEVHAFDIDPQALIATRDNAQANGVTSLVHIHGSMAALPRGVDLVLANILSGPLRALAADFAALLRPGGQVVLSGLMEHEVADVTDAYAAWFDVARCGDREGWVCLAGRRR
jgi:ribosomal protein L11 methyltransferase